MNTFNCCTSYMLSLFLFFSDNIKIAKQQPQTETRVNHFEDIYESIFGEIIFSSIIFRHSDRNKVYSYPNDIHRDKFPKEERGQLIERGKQRAHRLGAWTRARYAKLLNGRSYSPKLIKVYSSYAERTIQSAQLFLSGLFPPKSDEEMWNKALPWQPISVDPIPPYADNVISMAAHCPRYNLEIVRLKKSRKMKQFYKTYDEDFLDDVQKNSGIKIPRDDAVLAIKLLRGLYDTLFVQKQLEMDLPNWVSEKIYSNLSAIERMYFELLAYNKKTKRLKGGPLLADIIEAMVDKRNGLSRRLFKVYSGHVDTLAVLLSSLGVYNGTPPPYSAAVFIELRYRAGNYVVTVLYRSADEEEPRLLKLPNCKGVCTLDRFIHATSWLISNEWKNECYHFEPDYNTILF